MDGLTDPRANSYTIVGELTETFLSKRWSKREEVDFYRTVSTFGVEYNKNDGTYDWTRFRLVWL